MDVFSVKELWDLIKNASRWLANLRRANQERQNASKDALRKVIIAARRTAVYIRQLNDTEKRHYQTEAELATLWTELSFALDDLNVHKLAKRCLINGKQWADPNSMSKAFLTKADAGLARVEQLASQLLANLNN